MINTAERTAKLSLKEQLERIPQQNGLHADRYDTDLHHVLHVWDSATEKSYDIVARKEQPSLRKALLDEIDIALGRNDLTQEQFINYHFMKYMVARLDDIEKRETAFEEDEEDT